MAGSSKTQRIYELTRMLGSDSDAAKTMPAHMRYALQDELAALEAGAGLVLAASPTQNNDISYHAHKGPKTARYECLTPPIGSADDIDGLMDFIKESQGVLYYDLDGTSMALSYDNGVLINAGIYDENVACWPIMENVRYFTGVPAKIPCHQRLDVCGKAVVPIPYLKSTGIRIASKARHCGSPSGIASWLARQRSPKLIKSHRLCFVAHACTYDAGLPSKSFAWLDSQGFPVAVNTIIKKSQFVLLLLVKFVQTFTFLSAFACIEICS